jgi:hypothetical protein
MLLCGDSIDRLLELFQTLSAHDPVRAAYLPTWLESIGLRVEITLTIRLVQCYFQ